MYRVFLVITFVLISLTPATAQENDNKIQVMGTITDVSGKPLKGVMVFVDSIKTKSKTNRKGIYRIKLSPDTKILTVYSPDLGVLSKNYTGQTNIGFMYTRESGPLSKENLAEIGFTVYQKPVGDTSWYTDYSSILELLNLRFYNVRVTNGEIKIGKGPNQFSGDSDPLVLVNNQRMNINVLSTISTSDVKLIQVINRGSEAALYGGLKAANGVILITLK